MSSGKVGGDSSGGRGGLSCFCPCYYHYYRLRPLLVISLGTSFTTGENTWMCTAVVCRGVCALRVGVCASVYRRSWTAAGEVSRSIERSGVMTS